MYCAVSKAILVRLLLAYCLAATVTTDLRGQEKTFSALYVGGTAGGGYALTVFDPAIPGLQGFFTPVFGLAARYESPQRKSIELELRYRAGGWNESSFYEKRFGMLEIPILAHLSFGKGKYQPFFTLGETITYIAAQSDEFLEPLYDPFFDNKPVNNRWGFALNAGLGVMRAGDKSRIQLELRGTFQVTNIFDPNDAEVRDIGISNSFPLFFEATVKYLARVR